MIYLKHRHAFCDDDLLAVRVERLVKKLGIKAIVETGAYHGITTRFFADLVPTVHSTEINMACVELAREHLQGTSAKVHYGDSPVILRKILPTINPDELLLFLDSHWYNPCPTPLELKEVASLGIKPKAILIHDVKVSGKLMRYDTYSDFTYTPNHLKPLLDAIYGDGGYDTEQPEEAHGAGAGWLLALRRE